MANSEFNNGMGHKQRPNSRMAFYSTGIDMQLYDVKRNHKMAQIKLMWLLCDFLGIPVTILGIFSNIDNIKSAILAVLGIAYLCVRGYYFIKQKDQAVREKEIELWHLERDKIERIQKQNGVKK
jgi:hypothetical protein